MRLMAKKKIGKSSIIKQMVEQITINLCNEIQWNSIQYLIMYVMQRIIR